MVLVFRTGLFFNTDHGSKNIILMIMVIKNTSGFMMHSISSNN
jgi:hypothetical protein